MPQLHSVTLSIAKPLSPSFRHVFVNLADPAQMSMTNNSSTGTPARLVNLSHCQLHLKIALPVATQRKNWLEAATCHQLRRHWKKASSAKKVDPSVATKASTDKM